MPNHKLLVVKITLEAACVSNGKKILAGVKLNSITDEYLTLKVPQKLKIKKIII